MEGDAHNRRVLDVHLQRRGERQVPVGRPDDDLIGFGEVFPQVEHRVVEQAVFLQLGAEGRRLPVVGLQAQLGQVHFFHVLDALQVLAAQLEGARLVVAQAGVHEQNGHGNSFPRSSTTIILAVGVLRVGPHVSGRCGAP